MTQHSGGQREGRGPGKADKSDFTFTISEKGIKLNVVCVLGDAIGSTHVKTAEYRYAVHSPRGGCARAHSTARASVSKIFALGRDRSPCEYTLQLHLN